MPGAQLLVVLDAYQLDQHPSLHRSARDVEFSDVRLQQCQVALVGAEPDDERVLPDADQQVAVEQEADACAPSILSGGEEATSDGGVRFHASRPRDPNSL